VKRVPIFRTRHKDLREASQDFRLEDGVERKHLPLASLEALVSFEVDERVCLGDYPAPLTRGAIGFTLRAFFCLA
jgi:hypothetical protein